MLTVNYDKLGLRDGDRVLDVGCGEGRHTIGAWLHAAVDAVGVDLSETDLQTARDKAADFEGQLAGNRSIEFHCANALELPFPDASFDKVICSEVLEHIPDYQGVIGEFLRVLKPDGKLVISVPRAWTEEVCWHLCDDYRYEEGGHIRIFNATQLRYDVEQFGWRRYARHWAHALHSPFWWLKCWHWGKPDDSVWAIRNYHRLLVWDMMERPWLTRALEWLLNPLLGKSVVMYFQR